jgi:hypothetical protein
LIQLTFHRDLVYSACEDLANFFGFQDSRHTSFESILGVAHCHVLHFGSTRIFSRAGVGMGVFHESRQWRLLDFQFPVFVLAIVGGLGLLPGNSAFGYRSLWIGSDSGGQILDTDLSKSLLNVALFASTRNVSWYRRRCNVLVVAIHTVVVAGHDPVRVGDYSTSLSYSGNDNFDEPERLCTILFECFVTIKPALCWKEGHESFGHSVVCLIFWSTHMPSKLLFSYYVFEVYSMVLPSIQLTDDYVNYPNQSFMSQLQQQQHQQINSKRSLNRNNNNNNNNKRTIDEIMMEGDDDHDHDDATQMVDETMDTGVSSSTALPFGNDGDDWKSKLPSIVDKYVNELANILKQKKDNFSGKRTRNLKPFFFDVFGRGCRKYEMT